VSLDARVPRAALRHALARDGTVDDDRVLEARP